MHERHGLLLSVGIAALGWLLTHYVARATEAPTVEYAMSTENCTHFPPVTCDYRYELTNLTRNTAFRTMEFEFLSAKPGVRDLWVDPIEPAHEGNVQPEIVPTTATFTLAPLLPGASVAINVRAMGPRPVMKIRSEEPVRLSRPSLETFLVRHEMPLMILLIATWVIILAILVFKPHRGRDDAVIQRHLVRFSDTLDP